MLPGRFVVLPQIPDALVARPPHVVEQPPIPIFPRPNFLGLSPPLVAPRGDVGSGSLLRPQLCRISTLPCPPCPALSSSPWILGLLVFMVIWLGFPLYLKNLFVIGRYAVSDGCPLVLKISICSFSVHLMIAPTLPAHLHLKTHFMGRRYDVSEFYHILMFVCCKSQTFFLPAFNT